MIPDKVYSLLTGIWPLITLFTVVMVALRLTILIVTKEEFIIHNELKKLFYIIYIFVLFLLVTSTDFESYSNNFVPFREIMRYQVNSKLFFRNVIGNVLLFLPFGYLVTDLIQSKTKKCNILIPFFMSLICSTTIEIIQIFIGRSFDIDDIILNVAGGLIGYIVYKLFHLIINPIRKKGNESLVIFISSVLLILFIASLYFVFRMFGVF